MLDSCRDRKQKQWLLRAPTNAAKREESPCQPGAVHTWHETDMPKYLGDVRCWVNSGKHMLAWSFSGFDPGRVETFFVPPKTASNRARWTSTRPSEPIFAVSSLESIRAQPRAMLSDLNGHTARTT